MLLLADSGSTKTDWKIVYGRNTISDFQTVGFNPYLQTTEEIYTILIAAFSEANIVYDKVSRIYFYGAGCSNEEKCKIVKGALQRVFPNANIEVEHDLLAAARALCGNKEGIAAILGTGSNSCYYDGKEIKEHIDSVGFYLGDEGSGCYMGKKLIRAFIYKELPIELENSFISKYHLDKDEILKRVYQQPFPNRFLASFSLFLEEHITHPLIRDIIIASFDVFFIHHINKYSRRKEVPLNSTGSIGYYFKNELNEVAARYGVKTGKNIKSPIEGLLEYHFLNPKSL
jgi:N-acetylglucosamine kinase-like BadF-type ATPase